MNIYSSHTLIIVWEIEKIDKRIYVSIVLTDSFRRTHIQWAQKVFVQWRFLLKKLYL